MELTPLPIEGAWLVASPVHADERGTFTRLWDRAEAERHGLVASFAEVSLSTNPRRGTLRGLHYQAAPGAEVKLVTCVRGSIWDVVVDLREGSPTVHRWHAERLDGETPRSLYVPEGCAHGYLTLTDDTAIVYEISVPHRPELARGARWNDPALAIAWPFPPTLMNERDRSYPDLGASR